jgi:hypothetical protein
LKYLFKYSFYIVSFFLAFSIAVPKSHCLAQNHLKIFEDPSGGGSTQQESGTDNTFIYLIGGLAIAGILAYALFLKKDDKEEPDTSSVSMAADVLNMETMPEEPFSEVLKAKEKLPLDIFFGIRNDEAVLRGRTYLLGVSVKL